MFGGLVARLLHAAAIITRALLWRRTKNPASAIDSIADASVMASFAATADFDFNHLVLNTRGGFGVPLAFSRAYEELGCTVFKPFVVQNPSEVLRRVFFKQLSHCPNVDVRRPVEQWYPRFKIP
jgi:hypothetical protein